jgi:esterase/lipase superfamily enzyme
LQSKLYRRIPYKVDGEYRIIEVFYATDRKIKEHSGELYFKAEIGDELTAGTLKARIDPALKIQKVIPDKLKRRGTIGVQEVVKLNDEDFIKNISETVKESPHNSLLVLVYGFKDNFEMTATKAAYFAYLLDVDTPVLLFDWPGDQPVNPWGYNKARELATASGPYLGKLLAKIIREVKPKKLWIESSSLGCQVVCDGFEWMYQQNDLSDDEAEISCVAMSAPDVSEDEFDERFKDEMAALTEKLTTYVSSNDQALLMSEIINWQKKVGRQEWELKYYDQFEEAKDMLYLKAMAPDKISIIDMSLVNKASYGHGYDLEIPEYYDDFYMRIFDVPPHNNRRLYLVNVKENVDYWVMRGD